MWKRSCGETVGLPLVNRVLSSPHPLRPLWQEWERSYVLAKARGITDGVFAIKKFTPAASARTGGAVKRMRVEAAPTYLKGRVEREEALPEVEVGGESQRKRPRSSIGDEEKAYKEEEQGAVVGHVVQELKAELVVELMEMLRPR